MQCLLSHGFTTCHVICMALHLPHITQPMVPSVVSKYFAKFNFVYKPDEPMLIVVVKACLQLNNFLLFKILENFVLIHAKNRMRNLYLHFVCFIGKVNHVSGRVCHFGCPQLLVYEQHLLKPYLLYGGLWLCITFQV